MKQMGANYMRARLWRGFAVPDGHLITGQQDSSSAETAALALEALGG